MHCSSGLKLSDGTEKLCIKPAREATATGGSVQLECQVQVLHRVKMATAKLSVMMHTGLLASLSQFPSKLMLPQTLLKLKKWKKKIHCPKHVAAAVSSSPKLTARDWANLPDDMLDDIMKKLCDIDLPLFSAVCKSWRSVYLNCFCDLPRDIPLGVPILLLDASKSDPNSWKFARMNGELVTSKIFMPEAANKWICGSSWGWLVLADTNGRDLSLLNPLTRRVIQLPSVNTIVPRLDCRGVADIPKHNCCYIRRAILSANPITSKEDCFVIAVVGGMAQLSYCRIGDRSWTNMEKCFYALLEIIYHEGTVYATNLTGVLMSFDIADSNSATLVTVGLYMHSPFDNTRKTYLAMASGGRLLLISRSGKGSVKVHTLSRRDSSFIHQPVYIHVENANEVEIWHEWVENDSVGDCLLFLGRNCTFSLPAAGATNCCIFFTKDFLGGIYDNRTGVYDVANKHARFYEGDEYYHGQDRFFPAFWLTPSPW